MDTFPLLGRDEQTLSPQRQNTITVLTLVPVLYVGTDHRAETRVWREIGPRSHGVLAHQGQWSDAVCLLLQAALRRERSLLSTACLLRSMRRRAVRQTLARV